MARIRSSRTHRLRTEFFEQGKALAAQGDPAAGCWLGPRCYLGGIPIDYDVPAGTTEDSHNLDHSVPVSQRPDLQEDTSVFRHSHRLCNERRGTTMPSAGLGQPVGDWW